MKWVIQDKIFGAETDELVKHIKDCELSIFPKEGDIVRGSIDFVLASGGRWLTLDNYRCDRYYEHFLEVLNKDCEFMKWSDLRDYKPTGDMFVRPNVGEKLFTGTVIKQKWWRKEIEIIETTPWNKIQDDTVVLVAPKKEITKECRGLFYRDALVDWSVYEGEADGSECDALKHLVSGSQCYPDTLYTADVAWHGGLPYLLELNSFVSAGLYDMDMSRVVKTAEFLVEMCW